MFPKPKRINDKQAIEAARKPWCEVCKHWGRTTPHHIKTVGSGGNDTPDNLISLCAVCHTKAHNGQISKEKLREAKWTNTMSLR